MNTEEALAALPPETSLPLRTFVNEVAGAFGSDLISITMFGSAAEGRMRQLSDVNVVVVAGKFRREAMESLRETVRLAEAAIRLRPMFVRSDEVDAAAAEFTLKFGDIARRHVVLHGVDIFGGLEIDRELLLRRVRQVLLNLSIRLRERYLSQSLREEQAAQVIAETAGPLRAAAAAVIELEAGVRLAPREALIRIAGELDPKRGFDDLLGAISTAREQGLLPAGEAAEQLFSLIELTEAFHRRVRSLR
jgi:predicted nucleotidyltransferase